MVFGTILFKYPPMKFFGKDVLYDASRHITIAIFLLYMIWFLINQNKKWHIPYFIFSLMILTIISIQRIITNNHNDIGILIGLIISMIGIGIAKKTG